jgi:hypothetical protein
MSTFSEVQQPIICRNCKAVNLMSGDQLRAAVCDSCHNTLIPEDSCMPLIALLVEQRKLRQQSSAGPLTDSEVARLRRALSEVNEDSTSTDGPGPVQLGETILHEQNVYGDLRQSRAAAPATRNVMTWSGHHFAWHSVLPAQTRLSTG